MKKIIIGLVILVIFYFGYNFYSTNKKILNTWSKIENEFEIFNNIITNRAKINKIIVT